MRIEAFRCANCRKNYSAAEMMRAYRDGGCPECGDNGSWEMVEPTQLYETRCAWCGKVIAYKPVEHSDGLCDPICGEGRRMLGGLDDLQH